MGNNLTSIIVAVFASGGLYTLVQFFVSRYDNKKNIGKLLNDRIDEIAVQNKALADSFDEYRAIQARVHILRFADELRDNKFHSQEFFRQIEMDIKNYNRYCDIHRDFPNNITDMSRDYIEKEYTKRFLTPNKEEQL